MEDEVQQLTLRGQQILIAAIPDDPQALGLVEALRALQQEVILADTAELAYRADKAAVCIVVLHPDTWRSSPSIMTTMRCKPRYLLPVLAEPMQLPEAPWTTGPIRITGSLAITAQVITILISSYFPVTSEPETPSYKEHYPTDDNAQHGSKVLVRTRRSQKTSLQKNAYYKYFLLTLIVLFAANLVVSLSSHSIPSTAIQASTNTTDLLASPYIAPIPGPGCDSGNADWQTGDIFKNDNQQVITDNTTVTTCQQNSLLVKHNKYFDVFANVFFSYQNQKLPKHFSTQITASTSSTTGSAIFSLGVRDQNPTDDNNSGYGDDTINVGVDGSWTTQNINDITDQTGNPFTKGAILPAKTFTIGAEVDGPQITFSLNNQELTTITDDTFPDSYGISFGFSDSDAKNPPSASFSQFVYTPLADPQSSINTLTATGTSQPTQDPQAPYTASIPGHGCDKGNGQWQPFSDPENHATIQCLPDGLAITQDQTAQSTSNISFDWSPNFPANYKIAIHLDFNQLSVGCSGFTTHSNKQSGGYSFFVCADGHWRITRYNKSAENEHQIAGGQANLSASYTIEAISNGSTRSLWLDGVQVGSVSDNTFTTTDHIDLSMATWSDDGFAGGTSDDGFAGGTVVFSNFVFTPLP